MEVEIKQIACEYEDLVLHIRIRKPHQKETLRYNGREGLDRNNELYSEYAKQHRLRMSEFRKRMCQIHLGEAVLIRDGETPWK